MGVKGYFRKEFQLSMFGLEEENASDFYLTSFQKNRSAFPLFCIRLFVLLSCLGILVTSLVLTLSVLDVKYYFIFLTHWGLIFITVTSALAFVVSARALRGPIDATFGLPWYVKAYWVSYNFTIPIALFITVFYWILLTAVDEVYAINKTLDILIHLINSVLMLILLVSSRHPSRLLHFYHATLMSIMYLIFSLVYYYAGGEGPFGTGYIYPMLDWSNPTMASITIAASAVAIIILHLVVVCIAKIRDAISKKCRSSSSSLSITNDKYY